MDITITPGRLAGTVAVPPSKSGPVSYTHLTKEGKLFAGIIDLLEDISLSVLDLEDETATLGEYVEELDHDLGELEEDCYNCDCCEDDDCDCCGDFEELKCPACGESI